MSKYLKKFKVENIYLPGHAFIKKTLGSSYSNYSYIPYMFLAGGMLELFMLKFEMNGISFCKYLLKKNKMKPENFICITDDTLKKKQAIQIVDAEEMKLDKDKEMMEMREKVRKLMSSKTKIMNET